MIRNATVVDSEFIAKTLWSIWHQFKVRQLPNPLHNFASPEALKHKIAREIDEWLVCVSPDSHLTGFFAFSRIGNDKIYKKWQFPEETIRIEHFDCLLSGEDLSAQFRLLTEHMQQESMLVCIASSLRDAYWAALKAGFKPLGESPLIVGTYAWLYLDRAGRHEAIRANLKRAKILAA